MAQGQRNSKHLRIYQKIFNDIINGKYTPGQKIPNEFELAKAHNVSRPTIGRALNELVKKGLVHRQPGAGTFVRPPRAVEGNKLGLLISKACITPVEFGHFVSLYSRVVSEMSRFANESNYFIILNDLPLGDEEQTAQNARSICSQLVDMNVRGVFFMPFELSEDKFHYNLEMAEEMKKADIAVTLLDRDICHFPQRSEFDLVCIDNFKAGYDLTSHFIKNGCKKIDFVAGPRMVSSIRQRLMGYKQALEDNGIEVDESRIHFFKIKPFQKVDPQADKDAVTSILLEMNTEAIVCVNDRIAALIQHHLIEMGIKVPDKIRLAGVDDEAFSVYQPVKLTTMQQPVTTMAYESVRAMVSRIKYPEMQARNITISPKLIVRESCGTRKKSAVGK